ncbi:Piwi-domain-containing protein [Lophiostoma macrostomum CBS 122681]|uniref:Piwi-domain-containing protein n=1 Tax=Lophiostoma macrostomum CBS 122681 TaxID=1314788 RepID=A0A6A6TF57_9PLEO|nr:Piwi-domain-containing protein [Lophiostoma macrostomum CBS 122681]
MTGIKGDRMLPKEKVAEMMLHALQKSKVLGEAFSSCASDYLELVVSWKELEAHHASRPDVANGELERLQIVAQESRGTHSSVPEDLTLVRNGEVPIKSFADACAGTFTSLPLHLTGLTTIDAIQGLNIILNKARKLASDSHTFTVGSNKVYDKDTKQDLGYGLELFCGFFFTTKLGMGRALINVNRITTAFYQSVRLDYFMHAYAPPNSYGHWNRAKLRHALLGLRVKITYQNRIKTITGIGELTPVNQTFTLKDGTNTTVAHHLQTQQSATDLIPAITNSNCLCINLGDTSKPSWFPAETLEILPEQIFKIELPPDSQSRMINIARKQPGESRRIIAENGLELLGLKPGPTGSPEASGFWIGADGVGQVTGMRPSSEMLGIPFRQIQPPVINYSKRVQALSPQYTQWNLGSNAFVNYSKAFTGKVIVFVPEEEGKFPSNANPEAASYYAVQLLLQLGLNGVTIMRDGRPVKFKSDDVTDLEKSVITPITFDKYGNREMAFRNGVRRAKIDHSDLSLALLLNPTKKAAWADVFSDFKRVMDQEIGVHSLCITAETCSTQDRKGRLNQYMANIITDFQVMVTERLQDWQARSGFLPAKVLYYRDGVGNSQYAEVRNEEVLKIRAAYAQLQGNSPNPIEPKITAVIVTKRHHTRFYPQTTNMAMNCLPGTVVDSEVTHPCYFDFYLQSHKPVQGTARPTYYFVVENDIGFGAEQLQDFTYHLCFTYQRATLPVGYAPPAYYADRLCDRARAYMKKHFHSISVPRPPRLRKGQDEAMDSFKQRCRAQTEAYELAVLDNWKDLCRSPDGNMKGPWHSALNGTMFWM